MNHFERVWPLLEAALRKGNERGLSKDQVRAEVEANRAQLWPGEKAALLTELIKSPDGRFVHCWLGGGCLAELRAMKVGVEAWARALGCEFASINGRKGWERVFKDYERVGGELRKRL